MEDGRDEVGMMSAAGSRSGLVSGSSRIVSCDGGRTTLPVLLVDSVVGDLISRAVEVDGFVDVADERAFDGLEGVTLEAEVDAIVDGRFGGTEAAPPRVVLRPLSAVTSGLVAREVPLVPIVEVLTDGLLFSGPSAAEPSPVFPAVLR